MAQGVRPDGRGLLRGRRAAASAAVVSSADGSAMAKLGQTTVLAGVQAVPTLPSEAEPGEGRVVVTLDQPLAGGERGGQARQEREQSALSELLQRSAAGMVAAASLCIEEEKAVWECRCTLHVLEADGNLTDACLLAMLVALSDTALPAVRFSTGEGEGEDGTARVVVVGSETAPLSLEHRVYGVSFGLLDGRLLLDPTAEEVEALLSTSGCSRPVEALSCEQAEEEALLSTSFTLLLDSDGAFRGLHKPGGAPLDEVTAEASSLASPPLPTRPCHAHLPRPLTRPPDPSP